MQELERLDAQDQVGVADAREEMARWYRGISSIDLCAPLGAMPLTPGASEAFHLLRQHGVATAIVSITWGFAVAWFADQLGADYAIGTKLAADGRITHFWPADKAKWLQQLATRLGIDLDEVAAVGDSAGDVPMLRIVGRPYFVGAKLPAGFDRATHSPDGDIGRIAREIIDSGRT